MFETVKQGDVVGIISRNGAGKSTLLKILSRITRSTQGYAELWARYYRSVCVLARNGQI